jgi:steroid delta-isomerase-like uncharacterized protein
MAPQETAHYYWRAWTDHNLEHLLALLAPGFVSRSSFTQGRPAGKEKVTSGFKIFDKAFPDLREDVVSVITEEDRVACEVVETATFTGPMDLPGGSIEPTNRAYKLPVVSIFRMNAIGLIVEHRTYWDTAHWTRQIGINPGLFAPDSEARMDLGDPSRAPTDIGPEEDMEGIVRLLGQKGD